MELPSGQEELTEASSLNNHAPSNHNMLSSGLKPKLDLIFAEVEKKLPDIDFDLSDVDSDDEEPVLFHQHLKSLSVEEDKDLDTSQSSESLSELATIAQSYSSHLDSNTLDNSYTEKNVLGTSPNPMQLYDNDLAYKLQRTQHSGLNLASAEVTSWSDIPVPADKDKNKSGYKTTGSVTTGTVTSWGDIPRDENEGKQYDHEDSNVLSEEMEALSLNSLDDKHIRKQMDREKTRTLEKDLATNMVSPRGPLLSTQILDNIDLDTLLQNLNNDNQYGPPVRRSAWADQRRAESLYGSGEGARRPDKNTESLTMIQKLAQLSMETCGEDLSSIDPRTGASRKPEPDNDAPVDNRDLDDVDDHSEDIHGKVMSHSKQEKNEAAKAAGVQQFVQQKPEIKKTTASCGTSTTDFTPRVITARLPPIPPKQEAKDKQTKGDKEPTVFIDLRNFDQLRQEQQQSIERVQKVLGINPNERLREDSGDSDDDVDDWRQVRQKFKQQTVTTTRSSGTAVQKKTPPATSRPQPPRVINMIHELPAPSPIQGTDQTRAQEVTQEDGEEQRRRLVEEREKERRQEIVRKLREQRESERQAKLRLQKRLDALRPSASVSGRQDPAEATSTLFDMDASYEPAPQTLPPVLTPDTDCVLLTVHLSSSGEIVLHRGSGHKSVDTGRGLSASYTTLLTWLLALVPDNFTYLQDGVSPTQVSPWILPFYVVGLQQVLLDDQLCLIVAVTPVEQFDAKYVPVKSKKSKQKVEVMASAFQQHLTKYLSTNTLHSVCPWLQNMVSMEVAPMGEDDLNNKTGYVYKPPLPNITTKPLSTFMHINPDLQAVAKVFNTSVGFFWQTVDSDEPRMERDLRDEAVNYDSQNTISLIYKKIYQEPSAMMGILNRVLQLGLDLSGVRLVYPTPELMNLPKTDNSAALSDMDLLNNVGAVLSICIRGTSARSLWLDAVGPSDPVLARRTDPNSLCALYGGESRDECLLFCPRNPSRVQTEMARWFGGRVPPGNVIDVGLPYTKKDSLRSGSPKGRRSKKVTFTDSNDMSGKAETESHRPLAALTATTKSEIFLVLSPLVPPKCFGIIMASCQRRGFQVVGVRRSRLSNKRAAALGISGDGIRVFCPGSTSDFDESVASHVDRHGQQREAVFPSTVLQLSKENSSHSAASLVEDCMVQLTLQGIMGTIQQREGFPLESQHMIHAARYSDGLLATLGGDFSKCFDPEIQINPSYVIPQLYTNPEVEQITVLLLLGHDVLKSSGLFVGKLVNLVPYSKSQQTVLFHEGLELLGMKWLPCLTASQSKEVTPYEVGDSMWKESIHTLINEPCLVLALRGVDGFAKLKSVVPPRPTTTRSGRAFHMDMLHARTPEEAYTFIRLFFMERELFSDPLSRPLLPYIPQYVPHMDSHGADKVSMRHGHTYPCEESIFEMMLSGPRPISTFLVIKPRALTRHFPKILKKITQEGFKIVGLKLQVLNEEQAQRLIPQDVEAEERNKHITYLMSGPSLCASVQRENAVKKLLDLLGPEDPQSARRRSQFYWRGVFGVDTVSNALYGSSTYQESVSDQRLFFPDGLCCEENDITVQEQIPCPALDGELNIRFLSFRDVVVQTIQEYSLTSASSHMLLQQTTCIVLTPVLMKKLGPHHGYVDVIDGLFAQGFEFVGARMVWLTQEQAEHFLCLVDAGNFQQVPMLLSGPSIVLALQRDNAIVAFDTILRESFSTESNQGKVMTDSLLHKYGRLILRPADIKQAHSLLGFFFDQLLPSSQVQILPKLT